MTVWVNRAAYALALILGCSGAVSADVVLSTSNAVDPVAEALRADAMDDDTLRVGPPLVSRRPNPRPDGLVPVYDQASLAAMPAQRGGEQWRCLSEALYFEARGEDLHGIFAVAEVILNRVDSARFPDTVCGVVSQGTGKRYACQFSYNCDGRAEDIAERGAWRKVGKIARIMLDGAARPLTRGATHYHAEFVQPRWAHVFARTSIIGDHYFYRMPG